VLSKVIEKKELSFRDTFRNVVWKNAADVTKVMSFIDEDEQLEMIEANIEE
jgi:hypothetical protein